MARRIIQTRSRARRERALINNAQSRLFTLPQELRDSIYAFIWEHTAIQFQHHGILVRTRTLFSREENVQIDLPIWIKASKQILREAMASLGRTHTFHIQPQLAPEYGYTRSSDRNTKKANRMLINSMKTMHVSIQATSLFPEQIRILPSFDWEGPRPFISLRWHWVATPACRLRERSDQVESWLPAYDRVQIRILGIFNQNRPAINLVTQVDFRNAAEDAEVLARRLVGKHGGNVNVVLNPPHEVRFP
ncbi:hypothetical protein P280DRAFT_522534 [Massarina eburnea CBS 473.64]|uniref:F-box domain-containing protein n=1 Tax=Massarina eburnea CBS 473.64 TaxID=1395130 RepID=A0A6A6RN57_9PLEO|nr:hypothetical protein P280DRAFT_522534 [Massarina eburnea CBS 473.64]